MNKKKSRQQKCYERTPEFRALGTEDTVGKSQVIKY